MYKGKEVTKEYSQVAKPVDSKTKLRRQINDYLCKYASMEQLKQVASLLGVKTD